jgi:hypothetical protein
MDLVARFRAPEVDARELSELLMRRFKHAQSPEPRTVVFGEDDKPGLRVKYDRAGRAIAFEPIGDFPDALIDEISAEIAAELATPGPSLIARGVLFSNIPTRGAFRYRDQFMILPVPADAPRPQQFLGLHPFEIQVRFTSSVNPTVATLRRPNALREFELLCAALLASNVRAIGNNAAIGHWVLDNPGEGTPRVVYKQEMYSFDSFRPVQTEFTAMEGMDTMPFVDQQTYYTRRGYSVNDQLDLPATFQIALDRYFALDEARRQQFRRAAYWYEFAKETWQRSRSAAYLAFVSAVEALKEVDREEPERCATCGQRTGKTATVRFVELLDRLAPVAGIPAENRRTYFSLRSALVHGDKLLQEDLSFWYLGPAHMQEQRELRALSQIVQVMLFNWIMVVALAL